MSLSIDLLNTDCKENCENCPSQFPEPKVTSSNCLFFLTNILKAKDSIYKHDKDKAETRKCLALLLTTWLVDNWNCFSTKVKWDLFSFDYSLIQFVSIAETVSAVITFFSQKCEIVTRNVTISWFTLSHMMINWIPLGLLIRQNKRLWDIDIDS